MIILINKATYPIVVKLTDNSSLRLSPRERVEISEELLPAELDRMLVVKKI